MSVVISFEDYRKHEIDLQELGRYLSHLCRYTKMKEIENTNDGKAVPDGDS